MVNKNTGVDVLNKWIKKYYTTQTYIDIGWGELSWFSDSLVEMMAILYILEKIGILIEGSIVAYALLSLFVIFYLFGKFLKWSGVYDASVYVDAEIDPAQKEILEAARIIKKKLGE